MFCQERVKYFLCTFFFDSRNYIISGKIKIKKLTFMVNEVVSITVMCKKK